MKTLYLLRIASWLSKYMPSRLGYWLSSLVGGLVFYLAPPVRRALASNLRHVLPQSPRRQRRKIARRIVRNAVKNYYDIVRLPHLKAGDIERMITVEGMEHLDRALSQGKGAIIIGGHIGNFSMVSQLAGIRGYNVAIVAEDVKPPQLYNYVNRLRSTFGIKIIKVGSEQVRTLYRFIRNNGIVLLAVDRDVTDGGVPVQFFDAQAVMPQGPVVLAQRMTVPLIPAHAVRLRDNTSLVKIYPPIELERTGDNERDMQANMRKVAQTIEQLILKAPDQWVILQPVWNQSEIRSQKSEISLTSNP